MSLVLRGFASPQLVTRGFGIPTPDATGGMAYGGRAYLTDEIVGSGGMAIGATSLSPKSFLAALVRLLRSNNPLVQEIGGTRVFSTWPGPKAALPFVLIEDYVEQQPGEVAEIAPVTATLSVFAQTGERCMAVGRKLQDAVDTRAQNKRSNREPLFWIGGREQDSWRMPTLPPVRLSKTDFAVDLYRWQVTYVFDTIPFDQF